MAASDSQNSTHTPRGPRDCLSTVSWRRAWTRRSTEPGAITLRSAACWSASTTSSSSCSTHGEELPAQALAYLGAALGPELRRFDRVGHAAEGELLVVLPGADERRGEIVARRALGRLHAVKIEVEGKRQPLRISWGSPPGARVSAAEQLLRRHASRPSATIPRTATARGHPWSPAVARRRAAGAQTFIIPRRALRVRAVAAASDGRSRPRAARRLDAADGGRGAPRAARRGLQRPRVGARACAADGGQRPRRALHDRQGALAGAPARPGSDVVARAGARSPRRAGRALQHGGARRRTGDRRTRGRRLPRSRPACVERLRRERRAAARRRALGGDRAVALRHGGARARAHALGAGRSTTKPCRVSELCG